MEKLIELYNDGAKVDEIAKVTGFSTRKIYKILKENNIPRRKALANSYARIKQDEAILIEQLYLDGKTVDAIVAEFGYSKNAIYAALRKNNAVRRIDVFNDVENPTMRRCSACKEWLLFDSFHKSVHLNHGVTTICKHCYELKRVAIKSSDPVRVMLYQSKARAKQKNVEFSLKRQDIVISELCPVLGIPLIFSTGGPSDNSPSIDRIDSSRGYTADNIIIISMRANSIKRDATIDELCAIADFYKNLQVVKSMT